MIRNFMLALAPAAFLATLFAGTASARNCDNQDFKGVYSPLNYGNIVLSPIPQLQGPFTRGGRAEADGKGGFHASTIDSIAGFISTAEITGTYTVTPDCAITLNLTVPIPGLGTVPFVFKGAIADNGKVATVMPIEPLGLVIQVTLSRTEKATCSNIDLKGGYLINGFGTLIFQAPLPPGPFQRTGILNFDGRGGFSADTWVSYNGFPQREAFSGTYSVQSDCRFTLGYANAGINYGWSGMISENGQAANFLVTAPQGAVVTGTLTRQ